MIGITICLVFIFLMLLRISISLYYILLKADTTSRYIEKIANEICKSNDNQVFSQIKARFKMTELEKLKEQLGYYEKSK